MLSVGYTYVSEYVSSAAGSAPPADRVISSLEVWMCFV